MTIKTPAANTVRRWMLGIAGAVLPTLMIAAASCSSESPQHGTVPTAGGFGGTGGAPGVNACLDPRHPGCSCDTEGQHLLCGEVVSSLNGQKVCGKGFSVCTGGKWGDCIIDNAVTMIPDAPPGFYTQGLGGPSACTMNPCDPYCTDFPDDPSGLTDAGTNVTPGDGGLTLPGMAGPQCVPKTCADLGKDCGPVGDGCGALLNCGQCTGGKTCGGGGTPSVCGFAVPCTGLCLQQTTCPNNGTTTLSGVVYAPNGVQPLPNAIVYVPNGPVAAFTPGVSCDNCLQVSGNPLVSTTTAVDGTFSLPNMPVGANIPLVIQIGRWRRQVLIPNVAACVNTVAPASLTHFPRNKNEGDIPKMAFSTGCVDGMECVLRKMGVQDSEFTLPSGNGRINFYAGSGCPGTAVGTGWGTAGGTPWDSQLLGNPAELDKYDIVLFPCQGGEYYYGGNQIPYANNIANYANAGGRVFATHFSYIWLFSGGAYASPLSPAVTWGINQGSPPDQTGYINQGFPKGSLLASWLKLPSVGASAVLGQIAINTLRHDYNAVNPPTESWMAIGSPNGQSKHLTFNTPIAALPANQCGRVVFSDLHVENSGNTQFFFPGECNGAAMTPQEKMLEFMLFDLASCVTPDVPPPCVKTTCSAQGLNCGPAGDGCGGTLDCGNCQAPMTCGGGGFSGICGVPFQYSEGFFVRDYDGSQCPLGTTPSWKLWSWSALTPTDSHIDFSVQTASTMAGLPGAPLDPILFSNPPGPVALTGTNSSAHKANVPVGGQPDTELGSASVDATFQSFNRPRHNAYVRVTSHLVPSVDKYKAPTLASWDLQMDCTPTE